jgi:hypothetical protein
MARDARVVEHDVVIKGAPIRTSGDVSAIWRWLSTIKKGRREVLTLK